ncbi:hypothetical protein MPTK1_1g17430 [Marchantia polymorpha subsp. ruderalis]|uniref:DNA endonuclease activator Ctp1 C-terminal domain-containing protein n=2 Tax=Marchantia polymorpha TaxID=3197 RepID=A0A176VSQ5_MARPO|nr:hypothetical protein AXG93_3340s1040 [Marchantia polymorpha subsp. ruderalis]PTQ50022.1 hypothetical protein MARPO_0001s0083 [Marchantia polymorpha]BBM98945.1 hypothetical protein Mp_1g17430 [Marchantia polymorpha subsp. ruderalis]|eukprot:PTQ50022.1 hypothetical protein MARPO_0001s0083 [Marchantia polymorpha]
MDPSVLTMLRGSQCESVPFEHDLQGLHLSKSLVQTCTTFLAFMVDTQDYLSQMKNTYVKELWPKICAELMDSRSRVIELERQRAEENKEKEDSQRCFMQELERLRMSREDERSRLVAEIDRLRLVNEDMCEIRTKLQRDFEGESPKLCTKFEVLCNELEKQNVVLQQRIEASDKSNIELISCNEDLKKELQNLADEVDQLKKSAELASLKRQLRQKQRLLDEGSEDRYRRERRLSLSKQRTSQTKCGSLLGPWKGEQGVAGGSNSDEQLKCSEHVIQSFPNKQDSKNQDTVLSVEKSFASDSTGSRDCAPGDNVVNAEANGAAQDQVRQVSIDSGNESEEIPHRLKSEKNLEREAASRQPSTDVISVISRAAQCNAKDRRQGSLEPDKTSKGGSLTLAEGKQPSISSLPFAAVKAEVSATPSEHLEPISGPVTDAKQSHASLMGQHETLGQASVFRANGQRGSSACSKQSVSEGRGLNQRPEQSVCQVSKNSLEQRSATSTQKAMGIKCKERKWRQTRSRTEAGDVELHDSFLNTPMELAIANLQARGQRSAILHEDTRRSTSTKAPRKNKRATSTTSSTSRAREEAELATPYDWTDGSEFQEKHFVSSKSAAAKSVGATEGAENMEKMSRQSGARPASLDKEKQVPNSKAPKYKFNEPVRKKRDREQLEATDCNQCRKFYDAVLAEDAEGVSMDRCEHHDAVSRHRFKFLPPGTPAGFWNIGFDSEL